MEPTEQNKTAPAGGDGARATVVLFPGALGDFLCFLPTLAALRQRTRGPIHLYANSDWLPILDMPGVDGRSIQRREVADLFADGPLQTATRGALGGFAAAYSWTGAGDPNFGARLASLSEGPSKVFPFRGMEPREHAGAYFARCIGAGAPLPAIAQYIRRDRFAWHQPLQRHGLDSPRLLVVHPGSGSPRKNWNGFTRLIEEETAARMPVVIFGPADEPIRLPEGVQRFDALSLPELAALLDLADVYVGNDSGVSHLAGALGTPGVVLFGSSDPQVWRPLGSSLQVIHRSEPCRQCEDRFCEHRLSVEDVRAAIHDHRHPGERGYR